MPTATYTAFLGDPNREDRYLIELYPRNRSTGNIDTLRFSDSEFATEPADTPASTLYAANSEFVYSFSAPAVAPGATGLLPSASGGVIELGQKFGDLDYLYTDYDWDGRRAVVKHGGSSDRTDGEIAYSDYEVLRDGEVEQIECHLDRIRLILREKEQRFEHPVETRTLAGLGLGLEFDGTAGFVGFSAPAKLDLTDALTIEFWMVPYVVNTEQHLVGWAATPFRVRIDSTGHLVFSYTSATTPVSHTSTATFTAKRRYHVAISVAETVITFYIYDYAANETTTETFAVTNYGSRDVDTGTAYRWGCTFGGSNFYEGQLWNPRVFDEAATEEAIAGRRFRPLASDEEADANTIHYPDLTDGSGTTVTDRAGTPASGSIDGETSLTATTISASATGNKFTRAAGSFITDGWAAGDIGVSSGFATGANNADFTVTAVSALELSVLGPTLVNEAGTGDEDLSRYGIHWRPTMTGDLDRTNLTTAGEIVPNIFGRVAGFAPRLVDGIRYIYQVHASTLQAIQGIFEGAYPDISLDTSYTDIELFLAATTDAKKYDLLNTIDGAYIRLGSRPTLPITLDVQGDATGSGYVHASGSIVRRLVTTRGPSPLTDPDDLDTTAFSDLNTDNSSVCGIAITDDMTITDAVNYLLGSIGASAWFDRATGDLTVKRFEGVSGESSVLTITQDDIDEPLDACRPVPVDLPCWDVTVNFKRNYSVLQTNQIAAAAKGTWRYGFAQREWRRTRVANQAIQTRFPRARKIELNTALFDFAAAQAEAVRIFRLYKAMPQSFEIVVRNRAYSLDRFDTVIFHYQDEQADGTMQDRMGTSATSKFAVLGIDDDASTGTVKLTLWREDSEA